MGETGSLGSSPGRGNPVGALRHSLRNRWRCAADEVPCVLDGRVGSAHVAPGAISFVEHKRGPLGIKYVDGSASWVHVAGIDRGLLGGEVRIGTRSYEWHFRHPDHAQWAFEVVGLPASSAVPERPPLHPSPKWLEWLSD